MMAGNDYQAPADETKAESLEKKGNTQKNPVQNKFTARLMI